MLDMLAGLVLLLGGILAFLAGVGLVRMPDLYTRMHAASKAGTLGSGLLLVAVALHSPEFSIVSRVLAALVFLVLTAPVAAHLLGRAAYVTGVPLWHRTHSDEWGHTVGRDKDD